MSYRYITKYSAAATNWSRGRQGHRITGITIHHWGASRRLSFLGIVKFLCGARPANPTSAHYVAQGRNAFGIKSRRVACIVDCDDTAYHAGNWAANLTNIGIECRPYPTAEDYDVIGELVADLRARYGPLPLYPHRHWTATACPGDWDLDRIEQAAQIWAAKRGRGGGSGGGASAPKPKPHRRGGRLKPDGIFGPRSVRALTRAMGTKRDDVISSQSRAQRDHLPGITAIDYDAPSAARGSLVVAALQRTVGAHDDGLLGPSTIRHLQRFLRRHGFPRTPVDGIWGHGLSERVQRAINRGVL